MTVRSDATAWSALFLGLFLLASALGELRRPGGWRRMVGEIENSSALQMMVGLVELALGIVLYLANPWDRTDWLAMLMKALGGLMVTEALVVAVISDLYLHFWLRHMGRDWRGWAVVSLLVGLWLAAAGLLRFL